MTPLGNIQWKYSPNRNVTKFVMNISSLFFFSGEWVKMKDVFLVIYTSKHASASWIFAALHILVSSKCMMTSRYGNAVLIIGPLWGESTDGQWFPLLKGRQCIALMGFFVCLFFCLFVFGCVFLFVCLFVCFFGGANLNKLMNKLSSCWYSIP